MALASARRLAGILEPRAARGNSEIDLPKSAPQSASALSQDGGMPNKTLSIEQVLTLLGETPRRLAALTAVVAPEELHAIPHRDSWSANDVLAHLRACADVWGGCIEAIIAEDAPTLRAVNPLTWIKKTDYPALEFRPSLGSFAIQRAALLDVLEPLPPEGWSRTATVTGAGKALERNALFYGRWLAGHERSHIKQIERIVETVG